MTATLNRAESLGGSDIAAVMGLSHFRTPLDVWREKVLGQSDSVDTPASRCGERFEPHLLDAYRARRPEAKVWRPEPTVEGYRRASPDSLADNKGWLSVVEAKTTTMVANWGADGSDGVPLDYVVQGTWYADLLGAELIEYPVILWPYEMRDLLGLTPAEIVAKVEVRILPVQFSAALAKQCRETADRFWNGNVLAQVPPNPANLEDAKRLVWSVHGSTRPADEDFVAKLLKRDELKAAAKQIEAELEGVEFALREAIGTNEAVTIKGDPIVTCRVIERAAYAVKATKYRPLTTTKTWKEMQKP